MCIWRFEPATYNTVYVVQRNISSRYSDKTLYMSEIIYDELYSINCPPSLLICHKLSVSDSCRIQLFSQHKLLSNNINLNINKLNKHILPLQWLKEFWIRFETSKMYQISRIWYTSILSSFVISPEPVFKTFLIVYVVNYRSTRQSWRHRSWT